MNSKTVTVSIEPMGKPRMTQRDKWAGRPIVNRYWSFCDEVRLAFGIYNRENKFATAEKLTVLAFFETKDEKLFGTHHRSKPDADNVLKAVEDALVDDDSSVWEVKSRKYWARESKLVITLEGAL